MCVRAEEFENGTPNILLEQQAPVDGGAANAMKPFAFDLGPAIAMSQGEAPVDE